MQWLPQFKLSNKSKHCPPVPAQMWRNPLDFIAFGFGAGAMPFAPGTWGTLFAIPFYLCLRQLSLPVYITIITLLFFSSAYLCDRLSRKINFHDHPGMCIDEFIGFFVTMLGVPLSGPINWTFIIVGFTLFRLFDIWKPWPINWVDEKMTGGLGMIFDDVLAGIYAATFLYFFNQIIILLHR